MEDEFNLMRSAQVLRVDYRKASGSPPSYPSKWTPLWAAKVERIEINHGATPSVATVWFPAKRWDESLECKEGDNIRIRTDAGTVVFMGFVTALLPSFSGGEVSGGSDRPSGAFERNAFVAMSYRWLLQTTSPIFGQLARGIDDYDGSGDPISGSITWLNGRNAVFNEGGRPNRDAISFENTGFYPNVPAFSVFADTELAETDKVKYWTAKQMLTLLLSPYYNRSHDLWPLAEDFTDEYILATIDHDDWDRVLGNIIVERLNIIKAIELICKHLSWSFREDYLLDEKPYLTFYKIGDQSLGFTVAQELYCPPLGESPEDGVAEGRKLLWAAEFAKDITSIINNPIGAGMLDRFEFTIELVPAWLDADLEPDTSESNANLFFTDAQLQDITDKNSKDYFKYYHPRGSAFRRDVGRKWALNESGRYSNSGTYNRGPLFDFATVVPDKYIKASDGGRLFAPFKRQLLPCLTLDKDSLNSIGIVIEFSFDAGVTWQAIPAAIVSLSDECGIYIKEDNLAELVDIAEGAISGGDLDGIQLNLWTSLCDDILNSRSFKNGQWHTRVRVTASVQLDQRMWATSAPSSASGSPFLHSQVYDFSEKYGLLKRTAASRFYSADPPMSAYELDSTDYFGRHLAAIRRANEDKSISGQFTLERLWLGSEDDPRPDFAVGDCIKKIAGREYDLGAALGGEGKETKVYPEIIQIIYSYEQQKMKLITRDLRYAEVLL